MYNVYSFTNSTFHLFLYKQFSVCSDQFRWLSRFELRATPGVLDGALQAVLDSCCFLVFFIITIFLNRSLFQNSSDSVHNSSL